MPQPIPLYLWQRVRGVESRLGDGSGQFRPAARGAAKSLLSQRAAQGTAAIHGLAALQVRRQGIRGGARLGHVRQRGTVVLRHHHAHHLSRPAGRTALRHLPLRLVRKQPDEEHRPHGDGLDSRQR